MKHLFEIKDSLDPDSYLYSVCMPWGIDSDYISGSVTAMYFLDSPSINIIIHLVMD